MIKNSRGDVGIKAEDIAKVLSKAGWEWRRGAGDHIVISKPGEQQIVLAQRVTMAQWKNVERSVGMQMETLLNKTMRGKGRGLTEDELRKRFGLAHTMWRAGFPSSFVIKHAGLVNAKTLPNFKPKLFDEMGFEGVVQQYLHKEEPVRFEVPTITVAPREVHTPEQFPVPIASEVLAAPSEPAVDALLDLMQGIEGDVKRLLQRNTGASLVRYVMESKQRVDAEFEALLALIIKEVGA